MTDEIIKFKAEMLRKLVVEHKKNCEKESCGISTVIIYATFYQPFLGQEEASKNISDFL